MLACGGIHSYQDEIKATEQELLTFATLCREQFVLNKIDAEELAYRFQEEARCPPPAFLCSFSSFAGF